MPRVRVRSIPVVLVVLALPASAAAQGGFAPGQAPEPNATTPDGAATLEDRWTGARPAIANPPAVLLGVDVAVGAGGRAGEVRVRVPDPARGPGAQAVGPWTVLSAEPGVHRLPAPRVAWDQGGDGPALDQRTGGHRILKTSACTPENGQLADMCQIQHVRIFEPVLPDAGPSGTPSSELDGTALTVAAVAEVDVDGDLQGDLTEKPPATSGPGPPVSPPADPDPPAASTRTDLRVRAVARRLRDGRIRLRVTVANRGPVAAGRPRIALGAPGRTGRWSASCTGRGTTAPTGSRCVLPALRVGASRTVVHTLRRGARPGRITVRVTGDGPNLRRGFGLDRVRLRIG